MSRRTGTVKVYRPAKPGEGLQPGTVVWELARRQSLTQRRRENKSFERKMADLEEREPRGIWRVIYSIAGFFRAPN